MSGPRMFDNDRIEVIQHHVEGLTSAVTDLMMGLADLAKDHPELAKHVAAAGTELVNAAERAHEAIVLGEERWRVAPEESTRPNGA